MATEKDITDKRDSDVQLLDDKIIEAITMKNGLDINDRRRPELSTTINHLMVSRTDLHIQKLRDDLGGAQLAAALAKITKASEDLKTEAAKMKDVTSFINNVNAVTGAVTKVMNIVKNGG